MKPGREELELVARLLRQQTTLSLATTGEDGAACATPLFYLADEELSLYWLSSEGSQHSQNLKRRPTAAAAVYGSAASWREIRGVQMRGAARIVADPERRRTLVKAYCERFKLGMLFRPAIRRSALYMFQPEFFRYIDNGRGLGAKFELTRPPEGWNRVPGK
jgi:uncharacterized protein YhbP (UPF0306 family)